MTYGLKLDQLPNEFEDNSSQVAGVGDDDQDDQIQPEEELNKYQEYEQQNLRSDSEETQDENDPHGHKDIESDQEYEEQQNRSTVDTTQDKNNDEDVDDSNNYEQDNMLNSNQQTGFYRKFG